MAKNIWLFLSDPEDYHFDRLFTEKRAVWDGVHGTNAQKFLRSVRVGDTVVCYHTSPEKAVYGVAKATSDAYPDPHDDTGRLVVVDLKPVSKLKKNITLEQLKKNKILSEMKFLKIARLSVSPVTPEELSEIKKLGGIAK